MLLLVRTSRAGLSTNGFAAASACHRHAVSSAGGYRERRRLSCLSVALNTSTASKQQVAESVRTALRAGLYKNGSVSESPSAAVILASGTLASWLQDETFLAQILEPLADSATTSIGNSTELSVLTAAVDAIPRQRGPGNSLSSSEGLAILHGSLDKLLPGLWEGQATSAVGAFADRDSAQPALEFRAAPLEGDARPLRVIVPLANTIFTNGRPHTMFVSRWSATFEKEPRLLLEGSIEKTSQLINVHGPTRSAVDVPLVPITEARRIVAGLGNILRQVEIGVSPAPASKELELIIPKLLDARAKKLGDQATGPVSVWALLYPEHFASKRKLPKALDLSGAGESHEWVRAQEVSKSIPELLAAGCHIRKILSGGGGWGLKQGLLSLDPQTRHSTPDQEDVESFIRSFNGDDSAGGIVTPGSYVQFLVEPACKSEDGLDGHSGTEQADFGSPAAVLGTYDLAVGTLSPDQIEVRPNLFGAVSSQGIYVASTGDADDKSGHPAITTKIDASNSYVVSSL